jgi:SAM-dependent methyltransferase
MEYTSEFYDNIFATSPKFQVKPEESLYFPLWVVVKQWLGEQEGVIELGCGVGQLAEYIKDKVNYLVGYDYSIVGINKCRERNKELNFELEDLYNVKFGDATYISTEVLEHLEDDIFIIEKIPSGCRFIFSVPDFNTESHVRWFNSIQEVKERYGNTLEFIDNFTCKIGNNTIFLFNTIKK